MVSKIEKEYVCHEFGGQKPPRRERIRRSSDRYGLCTLLITLFMSTKATAGVHTQGKHTQGKHTQGTDLQNSSPSWLQGRRLVATLADRTRIEIMHFAGDEIHARGVRPVTMTSEPMVLRPGDLVGMQWSESRCDGTTCLRRTYRIVSITRDTSTNTMPRAGDNSDVTLYRVQYALGPESGPRLWFDVCGSDFGRLMGLFVSGRFGPDGSWHAAGHTFSCTDGVIAKCVRGWGYKPWKTMATPSHGPVDMQPLFLACTRAARAEYCADGTSYTRDGTVIDMFDVYGLNERESGTEFAEESTWNEHGTVSWQHHRIPGLVPECRNQSLDSCEVGDPDTDETPALVHVWSARPPAEPAGWLDSDDRHEGKRP